MPEQQTPETPAAATGGVTEIPAGGVEVTLTPGETVIPAGDAKTFDEAYVKTLREESAQFRIKARDAEAAADAKIKAALTALGITEAEDPVKAAEAAAQANAAERDAARTLARDTAAELIVWRNAKELGINPGAITDSKSFERAIKDLDPTDPKFGEAVKAAAKTAAENNPMLRQAQAAGTSGADFTGGTGELQGIDARIAAAEKAGDFTQAISLKRQKAYTN